MIIKTKMSVKSFVEECSKYGWNDGETYPINFESVFNEVAEKYGLKKDMISSSHNDYRYVYSDSLLNNIPDEDSVVLEWMVFGNLISE